VRDEVTRRRFEDFAQPEKIEILEEIVSARSR